MLPFITPLLGLARPMTASLDAPLISSDRPSERTISPHCEVKAALVLHRRRGALDERDADAALLPRWKRADTPPQLLDEFDMP